MSSTMHRFGATGSNASTRTTAPNVPGRSPAGSRPRRVHRVGVRRGRIVAAAVAVVAAVIATYAADHGGPPLTPFQARLVAAADSQVGYRTNPPSSYCNRFSAYWDAGAATCPPGERSEEWCADFAAWVWQQAGARFTYGFGTGEIDGAAGSFYTWALAHGRWHSAASAYVPKPGDVAVYGLDSATDVAAHVAVVVSFTPGNKGPNVVNGDGDLTGFSVVEATTDQYHVDIQGEAGDLDGYASPIPPPAPARKNRHTSAS